MDREVDIKIVLSAEEILFFQSLIRKIPVPENVYRYAVTLASKTRPNTPLAHPIASDFITWGAGPRASQYMIIGAKCHAALNGKYSPDIEDIQAVANAILRHRIVRNYKAEAEGYSVDKIIRELLK
jgi:MoxR-like ATPase